MVDLIVEIVSLYVSALDTKRSNTKQNKTKKHKTKTHKTTAVGYVQKTITD